MVDRRELLIPESLKVTILVYETFGRTGLRA